MWCSKSKDDYAEIKFMEVCFVLLVFYFEDSLEVTELQIGPEQIMWNVASDNKLRILWDLLTELL